MPENAPTESALRRVSAAARRFTRSDHQAKTAEARLQTEAEKILERIAKRVGRLLPENGFVVVEDPTNTGSRASGSVYVVDREGIWRAPKNFLAQKMLLAAVGPVDGAVTRHDAEHYREAVVSHLDQFMTNLEKALDKRVQENNGRISEIDQSLTRAHQALR